MFTKGQLHLALVPPSPHRQAGARRAALLGLLGLLLLLAQVAFPAGALAAPVMTVSPTSGPRGTAIGVSARGLSPNTDHLVQLVRGVGNVNTVRLFEDRTPSDARGELHYRLAVDQEPGAYTLRIVAIGGTVLATAPFTVTAGAGVPTIAIAPDRGSCSTQPVITGTGFTPGVRVELYQQRAGERGEPVGTPRLITQAPAAPTGAIPPFTVTTLAVDCSDYDPATPNGTRFYFTAVPSGSSIDTTTEPERRAVFTIDRGAAGGKTFPETGFSVRGIFLDYWRAHGLDLGDVEISERESLALFGYPISDEFEQRLEDGKTYRVQYFERARFEYHPENADPQYKVLLGQFGRRIVAGVPGAPVAPAPPTNERGARYFPETGHNVGPTFALFWSRNGGLAVFGYPVSEPFTQELEDGRRYTVQYFERARFEDHPAGEGTPYNVQLGQFGRQILAATGGDPSRR